MPFFRKFAALAAVLCIVSTPANAQKFTDDDWNVSLYANCELAGGNNIFGKPHNEAVYWDSKRDDKRLHFELRHGDRGNCRSDDRRRDGAKYWERAELQDYVPLRNKLLHDISFTANFVEGFQGNRETFFQIHGWTPTCRSAPLLMVQFTWQTLDVLVLQGAHDGDPETSVPEERGDLTRALVGGTAIEDVLGETLAFRVRFDRTDDEATVTVFLNQKEIVPATRVDYLTCAEPRVKLGIYRPGGVNPGTSHVWFDDLTHTSRDRAGKKKKRYSF